MTGNILPTNLEATRIIFGRTDGSVISDNLKLKENGEIFPALLNEAYWAIREGTLHFLNSKRETTTIFDKVVRDDEIIEYHGKFLQMSADDYHHKVEIIREKYIFPFPPHKIKMEKNETPRIAILLRSHVIDEKFYDLYIKLNSKIRNYDLFPLIDTTKNQNTVDLKNVIYHRSADARALKINDTRENLLWWYGDYAFYFAFKRIPNYDYYIMIEYDIEFIELPALFINKVIEKMKLIGNIDLVGIDLRIHHSDWEGWQLSRKYFAEAWSIYYPFVVLSKRALSFLLAQRQKEYLLSVSDQNSMHCEPFTAGNLMLSGFNCYDLNEIMTGSYDLVEMKIPGGIRLGSSKLAEYRRHAMIHPVYSRELSNSSDQA